MLVCILTMVAKVASLVVVATAGARCCPRAVACNGCALAAIVRNVDA